MSSPIYNGHELGQTSEDGKGQRGLAGCSPWGCKELDMAGQLNSNNNIVLGKSKAFMSFKLYLDVNDV